MKQSRSDMSTVDTDDSSSRGARRDQFRLMVRQAASNGQRAFSEPVAKAVVAAFGLTVPRGIEIEAGAAHKAQADLHALIGSLNIPLAVKLVSAGAIHKSDVGGVILGLRDERAVRDALASLAENGLRAEIPITGFLIEEMAPAGHELVIGGMHDPRFGAVIMLGLGGVHVEVFADVAFRICPINRADAADMLEQLRSKVLLRGARGGTPINETQLVDALINIGGEDGLLLTTEGAIDELDINPLMASSDRLVACDARITLRAPYPGPVELKVPRESEAELLTRFEPLFNPRIVAVLGASASGFNLSNEFIRQSLALGCTARIIPIHPTAAQVEGLPAARSIAEIGETVDYAYLAIAADQIPAVIAAAAGKVRYAQIISSGFAEIAEGRELERELAEAGRKADIRILGPNCLGIYSPRAGISFVGDSPREVGTIGVVSQSGGLAVDMLSRGIVRGLRFSALVTLGNSVDLGPADLVEYYLADPQTRAIGVYVEDIKSGRRFVDALRNVEHAKPVVVLLGGQTPQGQDAAASHTGSMATPLALWQGLAKQTGAVITETLEQFLDTLLAFQVLQPRTDGPTRRCVLFGNGGGTSVLAADAFGRRGLDVSPLSPRVIDRLLSLRLPPGTSVVNPIDAPANTLRQNEGRIAEEILEIVACEGQTDAIVMHVNLPVFIKSANQTVDVLGNLMAAATRVRKRYPGPHFALVLRSDGTAVCDERKRLFREEALANDIPAFDEMSNAADALSGIAFYEHFLARRQNRGQVK